MRSYGYRPITKELHRRGVIVNHKRVLRLLRARQSALSAAASFCTHHRLQSLVNGLSQPGARVGAFKHQSTLGLRHYLHPTAARVRLSRGNPRCLQSPLHWLGALASHRYATDARGFAHGFANRTVQPGLVHHSDRGVQYACLQITSRSCKNTKSRSA